jgi:hypothetical protein
MCKVEKASSLINESKAQSNQGINTACYYSVEEKLVKH